jgi:predicted Zn-dependent protease
VVRMPFVLAFAVLVIFNFPAVPQSGSPGAGNADPRLRFEQVKDMVSHGRFAVAIPELQDLLKSSPDSPLLYNLLGYCYVQQGSKGEAKANFRKAIALKPDYKAAHNNLAGLHLLNGEAQDAIAELSAVIRLDPADAQAFYLLGQAELTSGTPDVALRHLESAHRLAPSDTRIKLALGRAHAITGYNLKTRDPAQAVLELQKALEIDRLNQDYVLELSEVLLANYNPSASVTLLDVATKQFPDSARMWFALGISHLLDDKLSPAVTALKKSLELDSKLDLAYVVLARGYNDAGLWDELLETSQALIRLNPSNHAGYYYKAVALLHTADESARSEIEPLLLRSIALDPNDPEPRYDFAKLLLARGDRQTALGELEAAVHADQDFGPAYYQLYRLYRDRGQSEKSSQALHEYERLRAKRGQAVRKLLVEVRQRGDRP